MLVFCDCADKFPAVAMPAIAQSTAAAKRMRRLILSSPLQTTGRTLLARASMMARQTIAAAEFPPPDRYIPFQHRYRQNPYFALFRYNANWRQNRSNRQHRQGLRNRQNLTQRGISPLRVRGF